MAVALSSEPASQPSRKMDTQDLFRANLPLVERLVRFVCSRSRVVGADVDDYDSTVKLALIENDYAVLRAWEGRSSLATYLTVIIQRIIADERFRTLGRWRPSAEAKRLGESGITIESLLHRDGRSIGEIGSIIRNIHPNLTAADVEAIVARLPEKRSRPRPVDLEAANEVQAPDRADAGAMSAELKRVSERASRVIRQTIASLPIRERMLIRLHFVRKMSIADAARIVQLPQRPLYRRLEQILAMLRDALENAGIDAGSAGDLIGSAVVALDFGLVDGKNDVTCQSHDEEQA
jgi:RNA polymerase sigma factor (sigma-70 family)